MTNSLITVDAELFRFAYACASTEETRYYLNGVCIDPAPAGGVNLVGCDGHRLMVVHDPNGTASEPTIVRLNKDTLKACKLASRDNRRVLQIDPDHGRSYGPGHNALTGVATIRAGVAEQFKGSKPEPDIHWTTAAIQEGCIVDGTFPDWRRVLPSVASEQAQEVTGFNGSYLAEFGRLGRDLITRQARLDGHRSSGAAGIIVVRSTTEGGPALIRWSGIEWAFGVLMPMRYSVAPELPAFVNARPESAAEVEYRAAKVAAAA